MPSNLTAISFPSSPSVGQTVVYGNQTYRWSGTEWVISYDSNSIPIGSVTLSGNQTITGEKTFSNNIIANSQLLIGSSTIIPNPTIPFGYKLEITVENSNNSFGIYSFGTLDANVIRLYGAQGTKASPTAAIAGQTLGGLRGFGYNGSAWTPSNVGVNLFASENFTTTAQGTYITLSTTNHGSTTLTEKLRILHNGNVGINTTSPSEKLDVNGTIRATNFVGNGIVPVGSIFCIAHNTQPDGYLICNGQSVSTTTYSALHGVIGYTYGGSGSSFNVPDLRGEFVRGFDAGRGVDSGRALGSAQAQDWKGFYQTDTGQNSSTGYSHDNVYMGKTIYPTYTGRLFTGNWANPSAHIGTAWDSSEIRPRNIALNYVIKT